MGRKTWDSIPPKFRPLKGRVNIVISRTQPISPALPLIDVDTEPLRVASLHDAVLALHRSKETGKVFVIGGAEIYKAALQEPEAKRILLTRIDSEFECDTHFPLDPSKGEGGFRKCSKEEMDAWVGEVVAEGVQEENDTKYEFEMYKRD
jgi:dihydrofolate reductase